MRRTHNLRSLNGEVYDGVGPNATLRLAARVAGNGRTAVGPATGRPFARLLATPGPCHRPARMEPAKSAASPLATETARELWDLPTAGPTAIEEVPAERMQLS